MIYLKISRRPLGARNDNQDTVILPEEDRHCHSIKRINTCHFDLKNTYTVISTERSEWRNL